MKKAKKLLYLKNFYDKISKMLEGEVYVKLFEKDVKRYKRCYG